MNKQNLKCKEIKWHFFQLQLLKFTNEFYQLILLNRNWQENNVLHDLKLIIYQNKKLLLHLNSTEMVSKKNSVLIENWNLKFSVQWNLVKLLNINAFQCWYKINRLKIHGKKLEFFFFFNVHKLVGIMYM